MELGDVEILTYHCLHRLFIRQLPSDFPKQCMKKLEVIIPINNVFTDLCNHAVVAEDNYWKILIFIGAKQAVELLTAIKEFFTASLQVSSRLVTVKQLN